MDRKLVASILQRLVDLKTLLRRGNESEIMILEDDATYERMEAVYLV